MARLLQGTARWLTPMLIPRRMNILIIRDHWAYEAYFGGWIDFTDTDKPEDTLLIGKAKKTQKKWKWPWR